MNYVHPKEQRDTQPGVLYGQTLYVTNFIHPFQVEQSAYFTSLYLGGDVAAFSLSGGDFTSYRQVKLTYFLFQGHPF